MSKEKGREEGRSSGVFPMPSPRLIPIGAMHGDFGAKQFLTEEVRRVAVSLHEAGREPTLREVASRLTKPGSMRERIAREVLAQIRLELGPVRR